MLDATEQAKWIEVEHPKKSHCFKRKDAGLQVTIQEVCHQDAVKARAAT